MSQTEGWSTRLNPAYLYILEKPSVAESHRLMIRKESAVTISSLSSVFPRCPASSPEVPSWLLHDQHHARLLFQWNNGQLTKEGSSVPRRTGKRPAKRSPPWMRRNTRGLVYTRCCSEELRVSSMLEGSESSDSNMCTITVETSSKYNLLQMTSLSILIDL